jgi:hypothetical protein
MYCIGWLELSGIGLLRTPLCDAGPGRGNERDGTHDNEPEASARMSAFGAKRTSKGHGLDGIGR